MNPEEIFFESFSEPIRGCFIALQRLILQQDPNITWRWKYGMPFFLFEGQTLCYLWFHKKRQQPYIGVINGRIFNEPQLIQENRRNIRIFLIDPYTDLPVEVLTELLNNILDYYKR
jgi:hypothetical protein